VERREVNFWSPVNLSSLGLFACL